ncbi:hypothetical protein PG993_001678 [Apiospora rasikravindrae]|uniref:Protein kinase domain-containing protein n=1 Tax=Apiospora rasikravindrae TaxID=990691 RepID=A0ABR1UE84_9PEZI
MSFSNYSDLCKTIYKQLLHKLERRDEETLRFAVSGTAAGVLHYDNLARLFSSLAPSTHSAQVEFGISGHEFASRVEDRKLHEFLAILIFASCDVDAARKFTAKLVATGDWPRRDRQGRALGTLPADRDDCEELFGDVATADQFLKNQAYFCTVVLLEKEQNIYEKHDGRRYPYLEETWLSEGAFGKVFAVKIAKGHFVNSREGMVNDKPRSMARKDYILRPDFKASDEANVMKIILGSSARGHPNILENLGSLEVGDTYSLFMPLAICDLKEYMMKINPHSPTTSTAKADLIRSAEGLAEGLAYLHNDIRTPDLQQVVCYHMDLKPANILVFRENIDGEDRDIWKLSDFGMSRVKIKHDDRGEGPERMFDRRFIRRKPAGVSVSATINRRGEGTYLAPESTMAKKRMRTESDVCIIFTYLDAGYQGVEEYSEFRVNQPGAKDMDRFFCSSTSFTRTQTNPAVKKWHAKLIRQAYTKSTEEGDVFKGVLDYLEKSVLVVDQGERRNASTAKEVASKLKYAYDHLRALRPLTGDDSEAGDSIQQNLPNPRFRMKPFSKYFNTSDIDLSGAEYELEDKECFWQCISLTSGYLIASTTKPNFDPELTVKTREHKIPVLCFSPEKRTLGTLVIQSQRHRQIVHHILPLHIEENCAIITREKHLHIRSVRHDDNSRDVQTMVKGYRFVKVLTSWQDDKIFALGTQSANNKMILMEFGIPRPEEDVEVTTLTALHGLLYGEEFAATLSRQAEERYIIISTLRGTIYKVALPG